MICTLAKPIQIHHARQWVEVPEGARVELIRRADLPPRGPMLRTLDRANEGQRPPTWRAVRLCSAWPPMEARRVVVVRVDCLRRVDRV
jgi:hypothetical protein